MPMMAITTSNSISVKALRRERTITSLKMKKEKTKPASTARENEKLVSAQMYRTQQQGVSWQVSSSDPVPDSTWRATNIQTKHMSLWSLIPNQ